MSIGKSFAKKIQDLLPVLLNKVPTPFYLYDEAGIKQIAEVFRNISLVPDRYKNYFAVKALPNIYVLRLLHSLGMGFDCSSIPELTLAIEAGAQNDDIFFTSNNTTQNELSYAAKLGALINIDDLAILKKMPALPNFICFRLAPVIPGSDDRFMANRGVSKFGMTKEQLLTAYRYAKLKGTREFGLHGMFNSNELNEFKVIQNAKKLFEILIDIELKVGIQIKLLNLGGGFGIPYAKEDKCFDIINYFNILNNLKNEFEAKVGHRIQLVNECGRYITGQHGAIITKITNILRKQEKIAGVDACLTTILRPALYGYQHQITTIDGLNGDSFVNNDNSKLQSYHVSGSLCEANDVLGVLTTHESLCEGSPLVIHDAGAHCHSMSFSYNGRLRPGELLIKSNNCVILIRDFEKISDYYGVFVNKVII